jgi:hypothetical protein
MIGALPACRSPSYRRARDAGNPDLGSPRPSKRRSEPAIDRHRASLVVDRARHLLEDRSGELEPLIQQLSSTVEGGAEGCEFRFEPTRGDCGDDPASGKEVEVVSCFRATSGFRCGTTNAETLKLESLRPPRKGRQRDERLRDRSVHARSFFGDDQMVRNPRRVEAGVLSRDCNVDKVASIKRGAVVRKNYPEMSA